MDKINDERLRSSAYEPHGRVSYLRHQNIVSTEIEDSNSKLWYALPLCTIMKADPTSLTVIKIVNFEGTLKVQS